MRKTEDTRTPEQHLADVAAATSRQLGRLADQLDGLRRQFLLLGEHVHDRNEDQGNRLMAAALAAALLASEDTRDLVRGVAATLPVRGMK